MSGHSKGPWRVEANAEGTLVQIFSGQSYDTCTVNLDFEDQDGPIVQNRANADLIAAAPELAEALLFSVLDRDAREVRFYRETGLLAPGRSVPLEMSSAQQEPERRRQEWDKWCAAARERSLAALRKASIEP